EFDMADRRDWGGGGDDPEETTHQLIERLWESITQIRTRLDQQDPVQPAVVGPSVVEEAGPVPIIPPPPPSGVEVRESRRFLTHLLVRSRITAVLGRCLQQCFGLFARGGVGQARYQASVECTDAAGASTSASVLDLRVASLQEQLVMAVARAEVAEHDLTTRRRERERKHNRWEEEREHLSQQVLDTCTSLGIFERLLREAEDRYRRDKELTMREGRASAHSASFIVTSSEYQRNVQEGHGAQWSTGCRTSRDLRLLARQQTQARPRVAGTPDQPRVAARA
ncbi:hypothetical protein Taro_040203, partial [Colocasia esculenta]|nr:hypothetical protein [Colocasia esculenta]